MHFQRSGGNDDWRLDDIIVTSSTPLPITLSEFRAIKRGTAAELVWTTTKEVNSAHFEIERSNNGKDFQTVGIVHSQNIENGANYRFLDASTLQGNVFYRLKSVDFDGKYEYSRVAALVFGKDMHAPVQLPATLVSNQLPVTVTTTQALDYAIFDITGKEVYKGHFDATNEVRNFSIPVQNLSAGMYLLKARVGGEQHSMKFVKQ